MLSFESGHLVIRDDDGDVAFTTAQKMFTITDYVAGDITLPRVTASADTWGAPYVDRNLDHVIANIHPLATTVFGMIRLFMLEGGLDFVFGGPESWRQSNGANFDSLYATEEQKSIGSSPTDKSFLSALGFETFRCQVGQLIMNERLVMRAYSPISDKTYLLHRYNERIDYRLWCGFI